MTTQTDQLRQQYNEVSLQRTRLDQEAQAEQLEKNRQVQERAQLEAQEARLAEEILFAEFDDAIPYNARLVDENRAAVEALAALMVQPVTDWAQARSIAQTIDDTFQRQQAHKRAAIARLEDHFYQQYPLTEKQSELIAQKHGVKNQLARHGVYTKLTDAWPIWAAILQTFNAAGGNDPLFYQVQAIGYALTGVAYQRRPVANQPAILWDVQAEVTKHLSMPQRPLYGG